jgi:hypothetical protein
MGAVEAAVAEQCAAMVDAHLSPPRRRTIERRRRHWVDADGSTYSIAAPLGPPGVTGARPRVHFLAMCRNIRMLHNFKPPATREEIEAAALQFVRKVSGYQRVPQVNADRFAAAVADITRVTERLLDSLVATAPPRDRKEEAAKAKERWRRREKRMRGA